MKRFIVIAFILLLLLLGYAAWPIYGLSRIAGAIERNDPAGLDVLVDYPELRRSLTEQIVQAYLKVTGKGQQLGAFGSQIAAGVGASVADPIVEKLLNSKALLELFHGQAPAVAPGSAPITLASIKLSDALSHGWDLFGNSEYSGVLYYVSVPPEAPPEKRYRLRLHLEGLEWKLAGVGLPEEVRTQLVQELQKSASAR